jgi:hypothetical protein
MDGSIVNELLLNSLISLSFLAKPYLNIFIIRVAGLHPEMSYFLTIQESPVNLKNSDIYHYINMIAIISTYVDVLI